MSLEVNAGTFSYDKEHPVLMDITFSAQPGEVVAILGPNGAGKTTLLKCILGFLPWESGYTSLEGKKIREWKRNDLWKYISYVPQAREPAFSYRTEDMILLGRSPYLGNFSVPGKKDLEIVEQVMETAGISHLAGKNCSEISGGELQLDQRRGTAACADRKSSGSAAETDDPGRTGIRSGFPQSACGTGTAEEIKPR